MYERIKYTFRHIWFILLTVMLLWVAVSTMIQAFKKPDMTQTELFLHIPRSFICDWESS